MLEPGHVHDPCAGEGVRLATICAYESHTFSGTEIQPNFIKHDSVKVGDSTIQNTYPVPGYYLVTSIVYPNGMADDHEARDLSERNTYRSANGEPLEINNMGKYGYRKTIRGGTSKKRLAYWDLASKMVSCWDGAKVAFVNVSDFQFSKGGETFVEPVVSDWRELLQRNGWSVHEIKVRTQRQRQGSNGDKRVETESVLVCVSDDTAISMEMAA
jgi:hypothetical protein